jgi:hypothetical protein
MREKNFIAETQRSQRFAEKKLRQEYDGKNISSHDLACLRHLFAPIFLPLVFAFSAFLCVSLYLCG